MSSYRRTSVFINKNNSNVGSISSLRTNRASRIQHAGTEFDENEHNIQIIDPRFMIIEKTPRPPSPKKTSPPSVKIENWLHDAVKLQTQPRKPTISASSVVEKRNFQNLKRNHVAKSTSRTSKLLSISAARPSNSNQEVSSTNEEVFTPRRRKLTPKEKLRKIQKALPGSNQRTFDIHFDGCTNDSDECCLHRQCTKQQHECNIINLCCKQTREILKPRLMSIESNIVSYDRVGDGLDKPQPPPPPRVIKEEKKGSDQTRHKTDKFKCTKRKAWKPIYKLVCPLIIFSMISLSLVSVHYEFGLVYKTWKTIGLWLENSRISLIALRRPLTKWELWVLFIKKCAEKILGILLSPIR